MSEKPKINYSVLENASEYQLQVFSTLVNRYGLAKILNTQTFYGDRHMYEALGYPLELRFIDYFARYDRQDIAKAIRDLPARKTWQGDLDIQESDDSEDTPLETAFNELLNKFKLKSIFERLDRVTGLGRYGVLLLGLSDVQTDEDFAKPVSGSPKLLYLKPFSEFAALVQQFETDPTQERYGYPLFYEITIEEMVSGGQKTIKVHYSRIVHIVDDILESDVMGTPRLKPVFNRLMDLEKLLGGSAEMYWKGARPGYNGALDPAFELDSAGENKLKDQLDEFEHNLRRTLITKGIKWESLAQQVSDPTNSVNVQIKMISAVTGIPVRVLLGSEQAQLASEQDTSEYKAYIQTRRENFAEPHIIRPFIDILIKYKILPEPKNKYIIKWSDLFSASDKEKTAIGLDRGRALQAYTANPEAASVLTPEAFLKFGLGLSDDDIELAQEMMAEQMTQETPVTPQEQQTMDGQAQQDNSE